MASYLRPRRGKKATAISQNIILKRGEIFFEVPDAGVGKGAGKLKMGDGSTAYSSLPYFMEPTSVDVATSAISFTESSTTANATLLNEIASGAQLKTIVGSIKKLLRNLNSSVTSLNNDLASSEVVSSRKRYIQGYESLMSSVLYEFDDTHITNLTSIHIDDIYVLLNNAFVHVAEQTINSIPITIGNNYYVMVNSEGAVNVSSTKVNNATTKCIGGFHCGRVRKGKTVGDVEIGIVPNSVWTLKWRPNCKNPDAMAYIGINNLWGDIYLTRIKSAAPSNGEGGEVYDCSAYGALPGTGTEGFNQWTFVECLVKVGKRLSINDEFCVAADGSPSGLDNSNTNAWTATSNKERTTCGNVAYAVSSLNICDLVGNVWKWNRDKYELNNGSAGYGWKGQPGTKGDIYGPGSYGLGALFSGGYWTYGSRCGSRCVGVDGCPWYVHVVIGAWAVADGI